ncbi:hypothetical protein [Oceanobacillus sp. FSL W7-1309]|uniref:hypothetical protein n=1 Tax=Oceanobacillus sp. FSL W7-1309 TaxID=2954539 RepID=UPI0030FA045C
MSEKIESKESGFIMDLGIGNVEMKNMDWSKGTYCDEDGNVMTKEEFDEFRIKKLEAKVTALEQAISSFLRQLNLKVDKDEIINAINLSTEDKNIEGNKISIDHRTLNTK